MNPDEVERARRILRTVHGKTVERLVSFVNEHEDSLVAPEDFDTSGARERLAGLQQEIFVLGFLLSSLPAAPQPAPAPAKPPVENG